MALIRSPIQPVELLEPTLFCTGLFSMAAGASNFTFIEFGENFRPRERFDHLADVHELHAANMVGLKCSDVSFRAVNTGMSLQVLDVERLVLFDQLHLPLFVLLWMALVMSYARTTLTVDAPRLKTLFSLASPSKFLGCIPELAALRTTLFHVSILTIQLETGRGARIRTEITGSGGPRTSRCTTPL